MISGKEFEKARLGAIGYFEKAGIALTKQEKENLEVADFGFGDLYKIGLQVLVYVNTDRVCAKELVLFPYQTCPEHRHPTKDGVPGKEETFRCRYGTVYLYVPGEPAPNPQVQGLEGYSDYLTVFHEIVLHPGDQYTLQPDTLHWFRSGDKGAVVSEFSTTSTDDQDLFTDPLINRFTKIEG